MQKVSFSCFSGFTRAYADMRDYTWDNTWVQIGKEVPGFLQDNGNFIFYVDHAWMGKKKERKLVETTNWGEKTKRHNGVLPLPATDWKNPEKWNHTWHVGVINFVGARGRKNSNAYFISMVFVISRSNKERTL